MEKQVTSPFVVPPPNPTESEKVQRDYFESTIKWKESWIQMNQQTLAHQNRTIQELYGRIDK